MKRAIISILTATAWISISEFSRNQFLLHSTWIEHYKGLGLTFPETPLNGVMWGVWSLLYAISIYFVSKKYSVFQTTALAWLYGFALMWIAMGNLGTLPLSILWLAVPLSMVEALGAAVIVNKLS